MPYYKSDLGRRPHSAELMLRIHFLQLWHNLSDPMMEASIYDRMSFQKFLGFDYFGGVIPDESSICRFRHLLEKHGLSKKLLSCINEHLNMHGLVLRGGTIVDATLLFALPSNAIFLVIYYNFELSYFYQKPCRLHLLLELYW